MNERTGSAAQIPKEPQAWVLLSGLRDMYKQPHALHSAAEMPQMLEKWKASRQGQWPELGRHFGFNWSSGKIAFQSPALAKNLPIDGVMLYGTSPFEQKANAVELPTLGVMMAIFFGQPFVELHTVGQTFLINRNETGPSS